MSTLQGGPGNIVTDGLVLCLDAANHLSYPGSGNTWSDLAGSNNGTLINGPTFDSGNAGSIVFDGVDDYVDCGDINTPFYSFSLWIYAPSEITAASTGTSLCRINSEVQGNLMLGSSTGAATNETLTIIYTVPGGNPGLESTYLRTYIRDNLSQGWNYITIQWENTVYKFYINAQSKTEYIGTYGGGVGLIDLNLIQLGRNNPANPGTGVNFTGNIASTQIYNRALTASEVLQNYNSTKARFGL